MPSGPGDTMPLGMGLNTPMLAPPSHPLARLPEEWAETLAGWGEPAYRGKQVFEWIYKHGVFEPRRMSNLPKSLRERLEAEFAGLPLDVSRCFPSRDGTRKLLVQMGDGAEVETVLIPQLERDPDIDPADRADDRADGLVPGDVVTQCISSQVGCAMGCVFCASGVAGLKRHMTAAEIVSQVLVGKTYLEGGEHVRNIVLMGMGEPLHNYDEVARTLVLLTHPLGLALSKRRVTVSTSGLVKQIDRLAEDFGGQVQLAVSVHAVDDARRSAIMPINRKHALDELMACLRRYPLPRRRRITIEYTLIRGVNDRVDEADQLASLLDGVPAKVNLIPMNPIDASELGAPDDRAVQAFRERLAARGLAAFVRRQRGDDIDAACGQLAFKGEGPRKRARRSPQVTAS